jgi:hypothetical protein
MNRPLSPSHALGTLTCSCHSPIVDDFDNAADATSSGVCASSGGTHLAPDDLASGSTTPIPARLLGASSELCK